ncbi:MAG TPA: exodeoxyribonuclease VII small subunit [Candidatus Latescibacteria bacterium]|nr:exodeoxyribonuclease VII small subunit [Candidatus Latescibacterota bacterium]
MASKSFEDSLHRLEEIVRRLETGDLSLEESLNLFEEGVKASRECGQFLQQAKKRVLQLVKESGGTFRLEMLEKDLQGE